MVFPLESTINHSCKCHVTYTVILFICFFLKMEAPNFESIFECISDVVNTVLVLVHLIHHPILVLLRLYACLHFLSFQLKSSLAELYPVSDLAPVV